MEGLNCELMNPMDSVFGTRVSVPNQSVMDYRVTSTLTLLGAAANSAYKMHKHRDNCEYWRERLDIINKFIDQIHDHENCILCKFNYRCKVKLLIFDEDDNPSCCHTCFIGQPCLEHLSPNRHFSEYSLIFAEDIQSIGCLLDHPSYSDILLQPQGLSEGPRKPRSKFVPSVKLDDIHRIPKFKFELSPIDKVGRFGEFVKRFVQTKIQNMRVPLQHKLVHAALLSQADLERHFKNILLITGGFVANVIYVDSWSSLCRALYNLFLELSLAFNQGDVDIGKIAKLAENWFFGEVEPQAEETMGRKVINFFKELRDGSITIQNTELFTRFSTLMQIICTSTLAHGLGISKTFKFWFPTSQKVPRNASIYTIMEITGNALLEFVDGAYQYFVEGVDLHHIHTSKTYGDWAVEVTRLCDMEPFVVHDPEPDAPHINYEKYYDRVTSAYAMGQEIMSQIAQVGMKSEVRAVQSMAAKLNTIYVKHVLSEAYGSERPTPFACMIVGPPQTGKTTLTKAVFRLYHSVSENQVPFSEKLIYVKSDTKYWDGFDTSKMYVVFDDIGKLIFQKGTPSPEYADIIAVINAAACQVNMAAVEDKGKATMRCRCVVATSNLPLGGLEKAFATPSAALRRFPFRIRVQIRPEFQMLDLNGELTGALDSSKVKDSDADPMDVYFLTLERVALTVVALGAPGINVKFEIVAEGGFTEVFAVLGKYMKEFLSGQNFAIGAFKDLTDRRFCGKCFRLDCICENSTNVPDLQPQGPDVYSSVWSASYFVLFMYFILSMIYSVNNIEVSATRALDNFNDIISANYFCTKRIHSMLREAGARVEKKILGAKHYILPILSAVSAMYLASKCMKLFPGLEPQGNVFKKGKYKRREENVWAPKPELCPLPFSNSSRTSSFSIVLEKAKRSVIYGEIISDTGVKKVFGFPYCGRDRFFPSHLIPRETFKMKLFLTNPKTGISASKTCIIPPNFVARCDNNDICIVRIVDLPPVPNFKKFLFTQSQVIGTSYEAHILSADHNNVGVVDSRVIYPVVSKSKSYRDSARNCYGTASSCLYYNHEKVGDCGLPIFGNLDNKPVFLGFHTAGAEGQEFGRACTLDFALCEALALSMDTIMPQGPANGGLDFTSYEREVDLVPDFHEKNPVNFVPQGAELHAYVYGEIRGLEGGKPKHDVTPSIMKPIVEEVLGDCGYREPEFKIGNTPHGYNNPMRSAMMQIASSDVEIDPSLVEKAALQYLEHVCNLVEIPKISKLSDYEAINGVPGRKFVDGIKKKAGGGFGMFTKKSSYLHPDPREGSPDGVNYDPVVLEHIRSLEERMHYETIGPIWMAHMKNEPVRLKPNDGSYHQCDSSSCDYDCENLMRKEVRVFTGTPAAWSHVVRKYFLPLVAFIQENNIAFECGVGINATSRDWFSVWKYLTIFGSDRIIAGDYSKYDKRLSAILISYAFIILIEIAKKAGYSPADIEVMESIGSDTAFPCVKLMYLLIQFLNSLPSGHPLTVIINSICNSLLIRLAYIMCGFENFSKHVALLTYGDDNIMGVSPSVDFNHTIIAQKLATINVKYTMADKDSQSVPFISIWDADFLKRKFRWDDGVMTAPLDQDSLNRMLSYKYDTTLDSRSHALGVMEDCLREAFLHGPEEFQIFSDLVIRISTELRLPFPEEKCFYEYWEKKTEDDYLTSGVKIPYSPEVISILIPHHEKLLGLNPGTLELEDY